jgi:hypothetical protein
LTNEIQHRAWGEEIDGCHKHFMLLSPNFCFIVIDLFFARKLHIALDKNFARTEKVFEAFTPTEEQKTFFHCFTLTYISDQWTNNDIKSGFTPCTTTS